MVRRRGTIWYAHRNCRYTHLVGLTGYAIINILYNPITGRGGISEMAIAIEVFQIAYVVMTVIISLSKRRPGMIKEQELNFFFLRMKRKVLFRIFHILLHCKY